MIDNTLIARLERHALDCRSNEGPEGLIQEAIVAIQQMYCDLELVQGQAQFAVSSAKQFQKVSPIPGLTLRDGE